MSASVAGSEELTAKRAFTIECLSIWTEMSPPRKNKQTAKPKQYILVHCKDV